jgi:hypothetical protein
VNQRLLTFAVCYSFDCFTRRGETAGGEPERRTKLKDARRRIALGERDQSGTVLEGVGSAAVPSAVFARGLLNEVEGRVVRHGFLFPC